MRRFAFAGPDTMTTLVDAGRRWLPFAGALVAAASVALAAYAAHAALEDARAPLQLAALLALVHGVALAALAPRSAGRAGVLSLAAILLGILLFSGSVAAAHLLGAAAGLAPAGGLLLIGGWLLYAIDCARH